jgi:hypothetical protein
MGGGGDGEDVEGLEVFLKKGKRRANLDVVVPDDSIGVWTWDEEANGLEDFVLRKGKQRAQFDVAVLDDSVWTWVGEVWTWGGETEDAEDLGVLRKKEKRDLELASGNSIEGWTWGGGDAEDAEGLERLRRMKEKE